MEDCGIYRFVNLVNGKSYIGQSRHLHGRRVEHEGLLRRGADRCLALNRAWQKYGEDNFKYEVICLCDENELDELERFYIQKYNSFRDGYNCTEGGGGISGYRHTEEAKRRIGDAFRGKKMTEAQKQRYKGCQKGHKRTPEHRLAMSHAWTEERKRNFIASRSGAGNPNFGRVGADACNKRSVRASTGEEFATLRLAANWCGLKTTGNICLCCNGTRPYAGRHPVTNEPIRWTYLT